MTAMTDPAACSPNKPSNCCRHSLDDQSSVAGRRLDGQSCVKEGSVVKATLVSGIPAAAIALRRRGPTSILNAWTSMPTSRRNTFAATWCGHDAGANEPVLRSSDNLKCGKRFHDLQGDSMEDR
jgi:hypothetical protein